MEFENPLEAKEQLEQLSERREGWTRFLAITTALIAVLAAITSLLSGNFANSALLDKNDAVLAQSQVSDQYNYFQAKGIKKNLADLAFQLNNDPAQKEASDRYATEQKTIQKSVDNLVKEVKVLNLHADKQLEKHHKEALAVTLFQIAIALSAMSALLDRRSFWVLSVILAIGGSYYFGLGLILK
jgi:hypothetical protein